MIGNVIVIETGARGGARALEILQVLQKKGHACERAIAKALFNLALRIIVMFYDHRIDLRIDLGGSGDRLIQQFPGAHLFFPDEFGQTHSVVAAVFAEGHGATH